MQDLGTFGDPNAGSGARAINSAGVIAGWASYSPGSGEHGGIWQDGAIVDLGTLPGRSRSQAYGLNNVGQVVGLARSSDNHAFLWQDGVMQDLNDLAALPPGVILSQAYGINDNGLIVGQTCYEAECPAAVPRRAYLLVPNNPGGDARGHYQAKVSSASHAR